MTCLGQSNGQSRTRKLYSKQAFYGIKNRAQLKNLSKNEDEIDLQVPKSKAWYKITKIKKTAF